MEATKKFAQVRPPVPRGKIYGIAALLVSLCLAAAYGYAVFYIGPSGGNFPDNTLVTLNKYTYIALAAPIGIVAFFIIGTGFWIGWTILTIKVVPPMPEIVEKKDYSKIKAFFLCIATLALGCLLLYGLYLRNFWAIAVPATIISLVILGAIFWVGMAIITTRTTLPNHKKES